MSRMLPGTRRSALPEHHLVVVAGDPNEDDPLLSSILGELGYRLLEPDEPVVGTGADASALRRRRSLSTGFASYPYLVVDQPDEPTAIAAWRTAADAVGARCTVVALRSTHVDDSTADHMVGVGTRPLAPHDVAVHIDELVEDWTGAVAGIDRASRLPPVRSADKVAQMRVERRVRRERDRSRREPASDQLRTLEGIADLDRSWNWSRPESAGAMTAVMRVKNEAENLPFVLPPLLRTVERVVLVDNGSSDGTAIVATDVAARHGASDRLDVRQYPVALARCGREHLETPERSARSLTYFNNWSFSHVTTTYALKWDGDMVLTEAGERFLHDLAWRLEGAELVVEMALTPLWLRSDRVAYLDIGGTHREPWAWPNRSGFDYLKGFDWEIPLRPPNTPLLPAPTGVSFEIKRISEAEFDHWSARDDLLGSTRFSRERRTWRQYQQLASGKVPKGFRTIASPDERHVVEYARTLSGPAWTASGRPT